MRIIEGGMKNFCQHKDIQFDSNCPVVGLFAENGAGKTNFLTGINYLFTGELVLAKERYIRNYHPDTVEEDGKKPKWRADLWARFIQGGQEGVIKRWITPTTAGRELVWEGKTYTKAKEVEDLLEEILGADRKTVASAIFIGQGELEGLLFGTPADREKLFVKCLNLGRLEKVAAAAESRAKLLLSQVEDLTAQKDEIMLSIQAAARAADDERKKLDTLEDFSQLLTRLRCLSSDLNQVSRERASIEQRRNKLADEEQSLKTYLAQEGVSKASEIEAKLAEVRTLGEQLRKDLDGAKEACAAHERLAAVRNALETVTNSKKELEDANAARPSEDHKTLKAEEEKLHKLLDLSSQMEQKRALKSVAEARFKELTKELNGLEDPEVLEREVSAAMAKYLTADKHLKVLEAARAGGGEADNCPVCGGPIGEHLLSEENVEKVRSDVKALAEAHDAISRRHRQLRVDRQSRESERAQNENNWNRLKKEMEDIDLTLQDRDPAKMRARLTEVSSLISLHEAADRKVGNLPGIIQAQEATYENLRSAVQPSDEENSRLANTAMLPLYEKQIEAAREKYRHLDSVKTRAETLEERVADLREEIETSKSRLKATTDRLDEVIQDLGGDIQERLVADVDSISSIIGEMDLKQSERNTQAGIVRAREDSLRESKGRLAELEDRESRDSQRRGVAMAMQRFRDAFSRSGLPKTFIRYRFDQLASLTQENLTAMEASFSVFPSPELELSFDFVRTDNEDGYVMQQDQLSGGQRVTLSIAFLLALQQLVVPDIGFLVLDEPSLHLDERSRIELKDLLLGLSEQLRNSQAQVFVCDHSPDLRPAFQRLIQLKK